LTGITKTFVPFYSSFPEIFSNFAAYWKIKFSPRQ
jgi:Ca2+/Na+ antiporter